ncbi:MAG: hypothetical protein WKF35_08560 [Ferruginibacter sp.]
MKESYGTLSETMNGLKTEAYYMDFNIKDECIVCHPEPVEESQSVHLPNKN